jgi:multicomponent K+:H+ antiporter subunit E
MTRRLRMAAIAQLLWLVFSDIVRSNIAVARIVLGLGARRRTAGFLSMPLELRHPGGLAVMACIVTATPGTSWARYDAERGILVIHVLDLVDEDAWIRIFKQRYERRLLEIFA